MRHITLFRATLLALAVVCVSSIGGVRAQTNGTVELQLRDADLRSFVEIVAEATGRSFVLDPGVRGTVTVLAPEALTSDALYEVFLSVLELNRLTLIESGAVARVVPMNVAREQSTGPVDITRAGYETRVIEVRNTPINEVIDVIRPLLPSEAVLTSVPRSRLILLSDRSQNIDRIEALIARLDQPRQAPVELIRLRNANASEVLQVIEAMGIVPETAAVTVDQRSNALVVSGDDDLRKQLRVLAGRLDTQRDNVVSHAIELNYADAATLADVVLRAVQDDAPGPGYIQPRIVADSQTNALLITASEEDLHNIINMVHFLDRRPTQVLVEAVIFEMSVQGFSDLAVQFGAILNEAVVGGVEFSLDGRPSLSGLVSSILDSDATPSAGSGGFVGGAAGDGQDGIAGLLTAITTSTSTRLLSTPSIMTLNNQEAEIVVAQNVPFVTGSFTQVGESNQPDNPFQTIERRDVGLTLNVTPQINADRTVRLEIEQEVSSLTNGNSAAGGEITSRRSLSTTVLVRDGNVIMLGGLLEDGSGSVSQRVPGISKLPIVGGLFRGKNATEDQRVLLVMLRPRVVKSDAEARKLTRQLARKAKTASLAITPPDDGRYPRTPQGTLPFDGADLDQPFDAGFVDDAAQSRNLPPLPSRIRFGG